MPSGFDCTDCHICVWAWKEKCLLQLESCSPEPRDWQRPLGNYHFYVTITTHLIHWDRKTDKHVRPVGDGAKVKTCLVPEKLEFACFAFKQHSYIHAAELQKGSFQTVGTPGLPHGCILFSWSCLKEELVAHVSRLHVSFGYEEWSWMTQLHVCLLELSPGSELDPIFSACVSMEVRVCHTFKHDNSQHLCWKWQEKQKRKHWDYHMQFGLTLPQEPLEAMDVPHSASSPLYTQPSNPFFMKLEYPLPIWEWVCSSSLPFSEPFVLILLQSSWNETTRKAHDLQGANAPWVFHFMLLWSLFFTLTTCPLLPADQSSLMPSHLCQALLLDQQELATVLMWKGLISPCAFFCLYQH